MLVLPSHTLVSPRIPRRGGAEVIEVRWDLLRRLVPACGVVLAMALACLQLFGPDVERTVPYPHESAFGTTGMMLVMVVVLTLWSISLYYRCSDVTVRRRLLGVAILLDLLQVDALVKYTAQTSSVVAVCWYLYYIPLVFVPLLMALAALRTSTMDRTVGVARLERVLTGVGVALSVGMLTNGVHRLAFVFDPSDPLWDVRYSYGPVYVAVFVWSVAMLLAYFVLIAFYARRTLRRVMLLVAVVAGSAVVYSATYVMRLAFAFNSNYALLYATGIVIIAESSLDLGLLPSYRHVGKLFHEIPLDIKVVASGGEVICATRVARPLSERVAGRLGRMHVEPGAMVDVRVDEESDVLHKAYGIDGGVALLSEEITDLSDQRNLLDRRMHDLSRRNEVLEQSRNVRESLFRQRAEQELADDVESSLEQSVKLARSLLSNLPAATDDASFEMRRHQLMLVKLLMAYCKRKGALVVSDAAGEDYDAERFQLVVNESMTDARTAGIDCAAVADVDRPLPARTVNTLYDCIFGFLTTTFSIPDAALMVFVSDAGVGGVELRTVLDSGLDDRSCALSLVWEMRAVLDSRDVTYSFDEDDGELRLTATVGGGETS